MSTTRPRILSVLAATIVLLGSLSTKASAAPVTFNFSGDVTSVNALVASGFSVGDDMTGSLTYDSALVDSNASATIGQYGPLSSLTFTVGTQTYSFLSGSGSIRVENGVADQITFMADVTGSTVSGFRPHSISLGLVGNSSTLTSDALPTAFDTTQFSIIRSFVVSYTNRAYPYNPNTPGTSFTGVQGTLSGRAGAVNVPEPATLTLLCGALAAIGLRRRQRRSASNDQA